MKTFQCKCGNRLFFENSSCLRCGQTVGFLVESLELVPTVPLADAPEGSPRACANFGNDLCNWLVHPDDEDTFCLACRLNVEAPAPGESNQELLRNVEKAKRRLIFALLTLDLPVRPLSQHPNGLGFVLRRGTKAKPVITGHSDGLITLDLREADPSRREKIRQDLSEDYRTLLGHFRHESGHYYWNLFFPDEPSRAEFRSLFGDERADYSQSLKKHYASPNTDYENTHVSSYATSHPWEDWAETWAHYLHIRDSWETSIAFGLRTSKALGQSIDDHLDDWIELMIALNSMNRSMGHDDAYPFQLAVAVRKKLAFIDQIISAQVPQLKQSLRDSKPRTAA